MSDAAVFNNEILTPALAYIRRYLLTIPASGAEQFMLLAIAGQESNWTERVQANNGPAHSFWQFERGGGVRSLMLDDVTTAMMQDLCTAEHIVFSSLAIWRAMAQEIHDSFSASVARLLLWSDPRPLPNPSDDDATWLYYLRNWKPGKPSRQRWSAVTKQVRDALSGSQ